MVKVIKKLLIVFSLILSVGSVFGMQTGQPVNGHLATGNTGLPRNLGQKINRSDQSPSPVAAFKNKPKSFLTTEDQIQDELDERSTSQGYLVTRAIGVALLSAWRIQHYMTKICQVTGNQALLNDSLKFNAGCLLAAGGLALLDYNMPDRIGSFLMGALGLDMLNCWINGKTIKPVVEAAVSTVSAGTNMLVPTN